MIQAVEEHLRYLPAVGFKPSTIIGRRVVLKQFVGFLLARDVKGFAAVTYADLEAFTIHVFEMTNSRGRLNCIGYRNAYIAAVKVLFAHLHERGDIPSNPAEKLTYVRQPRRLPKTLLSIAEVRTLLAAPDLKTALGYRDRCILELLYSSAPRNAEVQHIQLSHLNLDDGTLMIVEGKGGKDRAVPLTKVAAKLLGHYIKEVRPMFLKRVESRKDMDYLFHSSRGARLNRHIIGSILDRCVRLAGIKKRVTAHTLRHACATHLLLRNANLRHIQELLGHASLQSTQVYTHLAPVDLKRVLDRCHPRNRERLLDADGGQVKSLGAA